MTFLLSVGALWRREIVRFYRQPGRLIGALGTPLVFWFLIGSGVGETFRPSSASDSLSYLSYFYPGTIVLILLFTAIFSTISLIEDRREGFLLSALVAPISRMGLVLGKILGGTTLAFLQGFVFVLLAPLVGIPLDLKKILMVAVILFLMAFSLTCLGFAIAWQSESTQGYHSIMNLFLFPMWLLSGALFPLAGASAWVQVIMTLNPLTYEFSALWQVLFWSTPEVELGLPSFSVSLAATLGFGLITFAISFLLARRPSLRGLG